MFWAAAIPAIASIAGSLISNKSKGSDGTTQPTDYRSPSQKALLEKLLKMVSFNMDQGTSLTSQQRNVLLSQLLGGNDKAYTKRISDINSSRLDPMARRNQRNIASQDRSKGIAKGYQDINLQDILGYNDIRKEAFNIGGWSPNMTPLTIGQRDPNTAGLALGGALQYYGGKGVDSYGAEKGWWS